MKYIITSEVWAGELELDYDAAGRLIRLDIRAEFTDERQHLWLLKNIPMAEEGVMIVLKTEYTKVRQVSIDLSFETFWKLYNLKEERKKCESIWESMKAADRLAAINHIKVYDGKLAQRTINKKYPATYLLNKVWIS